MLNERQGYIIAREAGMRYEPGWDYERGQEDPSKHVFHTDRMDEHSCWMFHEFFLPDSVEACIRQKLARVAEEVQPQTK